MPVTCILHSDLCTSTHVTENQPPKPQHQHGIEEDLVSAEEWMELSKLRYQVNI